MSSRFSLYDRKDGWVAGESIVVNCFDVGFAMSDEIAAELPHDEVLALEAVVAGFMEMEDFPVANALCPL